MAKVRVTLMVDEEPKRIVHEYCTKNGLSLSGFVNAMLVEWAKNLQGQPTSFDKPIQDLTLREFGELAAYWFEKASEKDEK